MKNRNLYRDRLYLIAITIVLGASFYSCIVEEPEDLHIPDVEQENDDPNSTAGTVTDIDGNVYNTVIIGDQEWMAENLKTTTYNDGIPIRKEEYNYNWADLNVGAYCFYENGQYTNGETYGALYNWFTVETGKLCPEGWHVPADVDFNDLQTYIESDGHYGAVGSALKSSNGWDYNGNGEDIYGFKAYPAGYRYHDQGNFHSLGESGHFWTSSVSSSDDYAWTRRLLYSGDEIDRYVDKTQNGLSIRCIKSVPSTISADFTVSSNAISPGETVYFTDLSTGDPDSWDWDFGDGNTSSYQNPSHTYYAEGTYTVELTVSDGSDSDSETKTNYITVGDQSNLIELSQHSGVGDDGGYYQDFNNGYGVVFDLSNYSDAIIKMADFHHVSWGLTGTWDYKIHVVDWNELSIVYTTEILQTTGDDQWEEEIDLGNIDALGGKSVGIFIEPMGNESDDAYPCINTDGNLDGASYIVSINALDFYSLSENGGDFIIDLWILSSRNGKLKKAIPVNHKHKSLSDSIKVRMRVDSE